ncbi:hypothetical protein [Georgenia soli]|uniref:hypothetical protein n=1 Tax=Georgenia soli TaxID=638953 RepID=UPI000BF51722|nr:hypothetical protein [Georgenia soli]
MGATARRRALVAAALVAVLAGVGWGVSASRDGGGPAGVDDAAPSAVATASATPSATATATGAPPQPAPTTMPDGSTIPSPSPGAPSTPGQGRTVPVGSVRTQAPVDLDGTGDFGTGLTVRLAGVRGVQGVARAPGEVAGPALEVTVRATNGSDAPIALDGVVGYLSYGGDRTPATDFGQGSAPLQGELAAGASATGTYVFAVPEDQRDDVRVEISYTGEAPTVAFEGAVD